MARNSNDKYAPLRRSEKGEQVRRWLSPALIFILALFLRLNPLVRYVTPDEPAWVIRSISFGQALSAGELGSIPATGHPGVTTMWLGSLGVQIHRWLAPDQATAHLDWLNGLSGLSPESPTAFRHLAFFLPAGRVLVALATSLGLVGIFGLASRLWGRRVALLGAFLLSFDPFLTGHSGLLHLDGLLTITMTLAALAALHALGQSNPYPWIMVSGLLGGLALLTKTPGGFLAPFVVFLLLAAWLTQRIAWRRALIALILWGLAAGLTFLALYPAMWDDPLATLRSLFEVGERHVEGALRPIFFRGQVTFDPGVTFYPVVWLFRASPLVLIGLPLALAAYLRRPGPRRFAIAGLMALAFGFGLFITLVGKKHDRYLLPSVPALTLVAALGWDWASRWIRGKLSDRAVLPRLPVSDSSVPGLLVAVLILVQILLSMPFLSTPLGYFNPLVGGPRAALDWLEVGWGEGLGAAARWLNQEAAAERLIVATSSIPPFASFFVGQTVPLNQQTLEQADYVVYPPLSKAARPLLDPKAHTSVYSYRSGGVRHATVIRNPAPDEQAAYLNDRTLQGDLVLLDAEAALASLYSGAAELRVLADARGPAEVATHLSALGPGHSRVWYVALPVASPITAQHIQQQLACRGQHISSEVIGGTTISLISLGDSSDPLSCDASGTAPYESRFDSLALVDHFLPSDPVAWPVQLAVVVRWEAQESLAADYRAAVHLKDEAGRIWAEGGQELLDADYRRPSAWAPNEWGDQTFQLVVPAAIPPGRYIVELGVFDPISRRGLGAWDATGQFIGLSLGLGQVTIDPPPHPPTPWDVAIAEPREPPLAAGPLMLLGQNRPPTRVASGDRVSFDLFWQATAVPGLNYALRWRLVAPKGQVVLTEIVPLSPYPTVRWRAQELEQVRYDLPVPPDLPAGDYTLLVNVLDTSGGPVWREDLPMAQVEVLARDRMFSLPPDITYPLDLRLGSVVHLRGFDLDRLSARPGDQLPLTLYWQADGPTDLSYSVFVHLVGPDGMLHGQVDRPPARGAAPTHSWTAGQVVIDEVSLPVLSDAPGGVYHIAVGLFDPHSADRLQVFDAEGAELPNRQVVLPVELRIE